MSESDVGHTVRLCYVYVSPDTTVAPEIALVLEEPEFPISDDPLIWKIPGGRFAEEHDDDIFDTTVRETYEEIGIRISKMDLSYDFSCQMPARARLTGDTKHFVTTFLLPVQEKSPLCPRDQEIKEASWFKLAHLPTGRGKTESPYPFALSHWMYIYRLFEDRKCRDLLALSGLDENRRSGVIRKWLEKGVLKLTA